MKKLLFSCLIAMLMVLLLSAYDSIACAATKVAAPAAINNDESEIGVMTQEYLGNNIAEILAIYYDGSQPILTQYGCKNPEIESCNMAIKWGLQERYNKFIDKQGDGSWIEIKSYPFSSADYLQIVSTTAIYPSYGTDGDITSYNFSKKENRCVPLPEVLKKLGLDERKLSQQVKKIYVPESSLQSVGKVAATGFLITKSPSGPVTQLLLEMEILTAGGDSWKYFYSYTPARSELLRLNGQTLFDPHDMDQMDPPLLYQRLTDDARLTFNTRGLTVIEPGREYSLIGLVHYSLEKTLPVDPTPESVLAQIKSREGQDLRLITITPSSEHSNLLSVPTWLVVYETGKNEDTRHCVDVYIHAGQNDFRLHSSVSVDYATDYHDEIGKRLATASLSYKKTTER